MIDIIKISGVHTETTYNTEYLNPRLHKCANNNIQFLINSTYKDGSYTSKSSPGVAAEAGDCGCCDLRGGGQRVERSKLKKHLYMKYKCDILIIWIV